MLGERYKVLAVVKDSEGSNVYIVHDQEKNLLQAGIVFNAGFAPVDDVLIEDGMPLEEGMEILLERI